jgi:multimeric flavodoxin WrbA
MNILALHGNPQPIRHTERILNKYLDGIKSLSLECHVTHYDIQRMRLMACERYHACKSGRIEDCIIKDQMTPIYEKLFDADLIVFSVPIVYGHLPGKTKSFIDRFYAIDTDDFKIKERKLSILLTYEESDRDASGFAEVIKTFEHVASHFNMKLAHQYGCRVGHSVNFNDEQVLQEIYELGQKL